MRRRFSPALWIVLLFVLLSMLFLRKAGLHYDAAFELACFYPCVGIAFRPTLFGHPIPVMVLPYLGTLKAWLYLPILHFLEVTVSAVRWPYAFIGATSIWLFFRILDRVAGRRAAIAGALFLATDATFVIATTYDFGPIALLHCFLLAGVWLLLRFETAGSSKLLALAFFLFGLALWEKALFVWMLGGLSASTLVVFPRRVWALLSIRRVAVAALALGAGALPLIYYNVATGGATLRPSEAMSGQAPFAQKLLLLRKTMDGSVMFGWLTEDAAPETAVAPRGAIQRTSVGLAKALGSARSDWMFYGLLASLCLLPWLWFTPARRPALFAAIYLAVTWGMMLLLPNTGASLHHVILLWPFPHFLIAVAGAQLSYALGKRAAPVAAAVLAILAADNLTIVNHVYADLVTRGTSVIWTDATTPLFAYLDSLHGKVVTVEWGYSATLCLLSDGRVPHQDITFELLQPAGPAQAWIGSLMGEPSTVFVDYDAGYEPIPGARERLAAIAEKAGYQKRILAHIRDRNRRARFEISRYDSISR
jgi:4-amino-4-deoxy-L-arabinose transferase-like glycosyltransferase